MAETPLGIEKGSFPRRATASTMKTMPFFSAIRAIASISVFTPVSLFTAERIIMRVEGRIAFSTCSG